MDACSAADLGLVSPLWHTNTFNLLLDEVPLDYTPWLGMGQLKPSSLPKLVGLGLCTRRIGGITEG